MSTTTQEGNRHQRRQMAAQHEAETASATNGTNGAAGNGSVPPNLTPTRTIEITTKSTESKLPITLPNRFIGEIGQPKTADDVQIKFAHVSSQFRNNQSANADARAKRYAKALADGDADGMAANVPLTAEQYVALWADYLPDVLGAPRMGSMEKLRYDATWSAWVQVCMDHDADLKSGGPGVIASAKGKPVGNASIQITLPDGTRKNYASAPQKGKLADDVHKGLVEQFTKGKDAMVERIGVAAWMADRVQTQIDLAMAKRGSGKAEDTVAETVNQTDLI